MSSPHYFFIIIIIIVITIIIIIIIITLIIITIIIIIIIILKELGLDRPLYSSSNNPFERSSASSSSIWSIIMHFFDILLLISLG